jgi:hypothetical protein
MVASASVAGVGKSPLAEIEREGVGSVDDLIGELPVASPDATK